MSKKEAYFNPGILSTYIQAHISLPNIERKGATMPYTSVHGQMFSFLDKEGNLALRLADKAQNDFLKRYKTHLCVANDTILKEYVVLPKKVFKDLKVMARYFKLSFDSVNSLASKS